MSLAFDPFGWEEASREYDRLVFQPALLRAGINRATVHEEVKEVRAGRGTRTVTTKHRRVERRFRWKDIRHTFATRLRMAGVELATIRDLLGRTTGAGQGPRPD